jgi:predicted negative regulator of RcsB-dependent stress response
MGNKVFLSSILAVLLVIAAYLGYLAWDRHQHNQQEEQQQQQDLKFDAALAGMTPQQYAAKQKELAQKATRDDAEASAAGLK